MKNKTNGMTLLELMFTLLISMIALGVAVLTVVTLLNAYRVNRQRLSDGLNQRIANVHLHKNINEASYLEVRDVHGTEVSKGPRLELFAYDDTAIGRYYIAGAGDNSLRFMDLSTAASITHEVFENVSVDFTRIAQTYDGKVTEVRLDFTAPFESVAYITCQLDLDRDTWARAFGGDGQEYGEYMEQTSDGGYVIIGQTDSFGAGLGDVYLVRITSKGQHLWSKTYGGPSYDSSHFLQRTSDGGFIFAGNMMYTMFNRDVYLVKIEADGDLEWSKTFGGSWHDSHNSVQEVFDSSGNPDGYIIGGHTVSFGGGRREAYIIKTDSSGNHEWSRALSWQRENVAHVVRQVFDTDGNPDGYIMAGQTESTSAVIESNVYLVKINVNGNVQWSKTFGSQVYGVSKGEVAYDVRQTSDRGYILVGTTASFGAGYRDVYLIKTDINGVHEWSKTFGTAGGHEGGDCVQETSDGGYIIAGYTSPHGVANADVYLIKTDSLGNLMWSRTFGGGTGDSADFVREVFDRHGNPDGYIISGLTRSFSNGPIDAYVIKTDVNGNCPEAASPVMVDTTSVTAHVPSIPDPADQIDTTPDGVSPDTQRICTDAAALDPPGTPATVHDPTPPS